MVEMTWVKHGGTGGVAEVPAAAVPQLRQSGWEPLTDKEIADLEQAAADAVAAVEDEMRAKSARETAEATATTDSAGSRGRAKNTKGND